jgi:hypothetical protein
MVAYSFAPQFVDAIRNGTKCQTIRPIGKRRHARPGEPVQLYTGMRTAKCSKIVETDPICTGCHKIAIEIVQAKPTAQNIAHEITEILIDGQAVDESDIAWADGFDDVDEMAKWFGDQYGVGTFVGVMITWEAPK